MYVPTIQERVWRKLGFHYHLGDEPAGGDNLPGWSQTKVRLGFSWVDRLRLLLTGRLLVVLTQQTDTPPPEIIKNRIDWKVAFPGERE